MSTLTFKVEDYDKDDLLALRDALHSNESLRLHFLGTLSLLSNLCQVSIYIPQGLKLAKGKESSTNYNGEQYLLCTSLKKLPKFENQVNENGHLIVDFEALVLGIKGNKVQVLLPESYQKQDSNTSIEGYDKSNHTLTIKTEHSFLLEMIERCLKEKPIVKVNGTLSNFNKSDVIITLPAHFSVKTADGGSTSIIGSGIKFANIDNLPNWHEQAKTEGYLYVDFEAVITSISKNEFTIQLPEWYNESNRPISISERLEWLTKKFSEEQTFAAIRFLHKQYEYMGYPPFDGFAYDTDLFDMEHGKFNLEVLASLDKIDIEGIKCYIHDAYFNTVGFTIDHFGRKNHDCIWADWDLYGYKDIVEVPLSIAKEATEDSTICLEFFKGKESLQKFLSRKDLAEYSTRRPVIVKRLERIAERKKQRKRP